MLACERRSNAHVALLMGISGVLLTGLAVRGQFCPSGGNPAQVGQWGPLIGPFFGAPVEGDNEQPFPMHAILLKTSKVLVIPTEDIQLNIKVMLLDPNNPVTTFNREFSVPEAFTFQSCEAFAIRIPCMP